MARVLAVAVVVAGCASPTAPDLGPSLVTIVGDASATRLEVTPPDTNSLPYELDFPTTGVRLPSKLVIGLVDALATNACPTESGIGVAVFPAIVATPLDRGGPASDTGDVSVTMPGPGVGQVRVEWTAPYMCGGAQVASGVSTFTAFPTGRIVRHDEMVVPSSTTLMPGADCTCNSMPGSFFFTSFYAFAPGDDVNRDGSGASDGNQQYCTLYGDHGIGVSWPDSATRVPHQSVYVHDWANNVPTLEPVAQHLTSALQISPQNDCNAIQFGLDDNMLSIGGDPKSTDDNGLFVDDTRHDAPFDITTSDPNIDVSPGFAIVLNMDPHATITRTPPLAGQFFIAQLLPDADRVLVWFRDGLAGGETIHVEPQ
jgi:hypothetical protein